MTLRRGACPSLSAPMQTGDGLLVRLSPADGRLTPQQLAGIARAAARHGNGLIEITARGKLQIRGLTRDSAGALADDITGLGVAFHDGATVETGPLAGLDVEEILDPRPLAGMIRAGSNPFAGRLAPKLSVVVDGGGALGLDGLLTDIRLLAEYGGWRLLTGNRDYGVLNEEAAATATLDLLALLAQDGGRAAGLDDAHLAGLGLTVRQTPRREAAPLRLPVGDFLLGDGSTAHGFALPFGQIDSGRLEGLAQAAHEAGEMRLARGRGLLVLGLGEEQAATLRAFAAAQGFITAPDDPRLRIVACAGAPACRSGRLATKAIAEAIARDLSGLLPTNRLIQISGCAKRCSAPVEPSPSLIGADDDCFLERDADLPADLRDALLDLGHSFRIPHDH